MNKPSDYNIEVSVIVAVYNHWHWLEMILTALHHQTFKNFEVIIADDGSLPEITNNLMKWKSTFEITHIRHEDKGWRKNIILNQAIKASKGDYLIFLDGDCIPHPKWISDHLVLRKKGEILSGRRVDLPKSISDKISTADFDCRHFPSRLNPKIFFKAIAEKGISKLRWLRFPFPSKVKLLKRNKGVLGCNFSIYKDDFLAINGFDERYLHPGTGEDTDVELRLANAGYNAQIFSHYMIVYHRNHNRLDMSHSDNQKILEEHKIKNIGYTPYGILQ